MYVFKLKANHVDVTALSCYVYTVVQSYHKPIKDKVKDIYMYIY